MNNQYFEGLNQKVKQILEYLDSKSNEEIGAIFSREISDRTKIDLNSYGEQIKRSFKMIDQRHDYIIQILKTLDDQEKQFFYDISVDAQEQMRVNLRTISTYIPDLESVYSSNGGINDLFSIDQSFRNTYEAFIVYARIAKISLDNLNKKIAEDLNPSFKSKNSQVDQLIAELKIYKGKHHLEKLKKYIRKNMKTIRGPLKYMNFILCYLYVYQLL
ncbi:hypothetical protein DX910_01175 [Acinetobacter haemolyticus]|nr:hypothetical protein DX910_01175 [Acinetobacter haemolyticus]